MSIKTLSPYYLTIPLTNPLTGVVCNSFTLKIYIWDGSKIAVPSEPVYVITKINAAMTAGNEKINIARIVNDFIEFGCESFLTTTLRDANNQVWVKTECYYDDLPTVSGLYSMNLATKGYGYFLQGENPQLPTNKILLTGDEFKVNRNGHFVLPLLATEPSVSSRVLTIVTVSFVSGRSFTYSITSNFSAGEITKFVRTVGTPEWIPVPADSGTFVLTTDVDIDNFEMKATAFDVVTVQIITSNIYPVT